MKSLIYTVIITVLTLTLNAQSISFNALKEAALGNDDVLRVALAYRLLKTTQVTKETLEHALVRYQ